MEIDISTLRTELEQRLVVAHEALQSALEEQGEFDEDGEWEPNYDSMDAEWGEPTGQINALESLLRWLTLYEEAAKDGN